MSLVIRPETTADWEEIRQVNHRAFGQAEEARLVDALREGGHARLSLVAEQAGQVVGHILFSNLSIFTETETVPALALAPLAVLPEFQKQGIGSALVRRGLELCREQGHRIVVVLGHPHFYPRFGFSSRLASALTSPFGSGDFWMALELVTGALNQVSGQVTYPAPFNPDPQVRPRKQGDSGGQQTLLVLDDVFAVCRLSAGATIPPWATAGRFFSITGTPEELSLVCRQDLVPEGVESERGWRCFRVAGSIPFSVVGLLASLTAPLTHAGISVFAVSTFDTDYLLVKDTDFAKAITVWQNAGHSIRQ
jgi:putative acetyltransferase